MNRARKRKGRPKAALEEIMQHGTDGGNTPPTNWSVDDVLHDELPSLCQPVFSGRERLMAGDWYKRYPVDFIDGTQGLSLETKGAYSICLDLMYSYQGSIPDDARWIASVCGCSVRKWNSIRAELIEIGKLVENDGRLENDRMLSEVLSRAKHAENSSKGGRKSAEMRAESNKIKQVGSRRRVEKSREEPQTNAFVDLLDWNPSELDRQYAKQHNVDPDRILEDIRDWAANAPPAKRRKKSPERFWKMWVRREADRQPRRREDLKFDHL